MELKEKDKFWVISTWDAEKMTVWHNSSLYYSFLTYIQQTKEHILILWKDKNNIKLNETSQEQNMKFKTTSKHITESIKCCLNTIHIKIVC